MSAGALTLSMMEQVLKKMYLPAVEESLNNQLAFAKNIDATWNDVTPSAVAWWKNPIVPSDPPVDVVFELDWGEKPVYTHIPMGLHIVSVKWAEWDGQLLHRVPVQDAYELILTADCILVPQKSGISTKTLQHIFKSQADAVGGNMAPQPWTLPMQQEEVRKYPRTQVFSKTLISGVLVHSVKGSDGMAKLLQNVTTNVVDQMIEFLKPRVAAGAAYDWLGDPEMAIQMPKGGV